GATFKIPATSSHHEEALDDPLAVLIADEDDIVHVLLLLPQGDALIASGSSSAMRSRTVALPKLPISSVTTVSKLAAQAVASTAPPKINRAYPLPQPNQPIECPKNDEPFVHPLLYKGSGFLDNYLLWNMIT